MNYFAHGYRYIDQPYFLVGTAIPDLLSVVDRRVRMRPGRTEDYLSTAVAPQYEIAAGVLQHLQDDQLFHNTRAFIEVSGQLTRLFRILLESDENHRPSFLGHIVTEILLDGVLIAEHPLKLDAYYASFQSVDPHIIEQTINQISKVQTTRLAAFISIFEQEQFLRDYLNPEQLRLRLNQVMRRVKLNLLPIETIAVLEQGWEIVSARKEELLVHSD